MKYIKLFEGRPKTKWVKCIKDYYYVLNDDHVAVNPHLTLNDKKFYQYFEKGKMYKMHGPYQCISDDYIVYVSTKIKHANGRPDYEKFISTIFVFDGKGKEGQLLFEDYFEMTEETKNLIEWYYIEKLANKYNI